MQIPPDASKYTRPHLPPIVSRDRLIARLREKGSANRVLLIGQAAQGKTTLAAAYAETIGGPAAWLHLEAGDGDRRRFFSLLVQALAQACPDAPLDRFRDHGAMAMGGTDSEARYGARLDALWALLADAGCVVLDGLDRLPGDAGAAFLVSRLLHLARSGPRLILTSRRLPAFSLQRWTVRRELLTVSNEELAFTPEEIGRYLEILHDLRVDPAVCETLHRVTGGWPGGLALLTQALERVPQDEWQRWLSARLPDKVSWAALRFFSEEVFSAQSPDIQDLLMRASLQEAIDPRLLDGGDADGAVAATLDELAARHLFIQRIHDDRGGTLYRMNGLFRRFLRGRFEAAYTSDRRRALRVETAERSAALERWEPAIRLWIEAGAIDAAAAGIRKIATDWVIRGRLPDLSAQLSSLPPDRVEADPWLFFFQVLTRRFRDGVRSIEGFRSALRRFTEAGEAGGEMLALAYLIESHVFYGLDPASCRPWIAKGERWLAERSAKPYFAYAKTVLWLQIGFACVATGLDVSRGLSASQNAYLLAGRIGDGPLMVTATLVSVLGLAQAGQFERADEALRRIDSRVDSVVFAEYEVLRDLVHVELALHRGDLDVARDRLETMARGIDTFGLTYLYPALVDASGRCQVYRGDFSGAKDTCRHLRDVAVLSGSAFYEGLAHRLAGLIHYHQGRYPEAESALEDALRAFSEEDTGHLHPMRTRQILGVVLLHRDQLERADALLRQALAYFADSDHPLSQAETHVALGLLHHRRGEPNSARRHLTRAGRLSAARGLRHFIVLKAEDAELAARLAAPWLGTGDGLLSATDRGETPPSRPAVSASPAPEGGLLQGRAVPAPDGGEALLEIRTFGGLQVTRRGGGPVEKGEWGGRRPRLLLKAIVVHGIREVPREMLMDDLWPDSAPEAAARNFKVALHRLRRCLEPDLDPSKGSRFVHLKDNRVSLSRRRCWVDLEAFLGCCRELKRLALAGETRSAADLGGRILALYRGDFLPEEPYAGWVEMKRWALRDAFLESLLRAAEICRRGGLPDQAAEFCRACIQVDPCHEPAGRLLMTLLSGTGRRRQAVQVYEALCGALREVVGVAPEAETVALYRRIAGGEGTGPGS